MRYGCPNSKCDYHLKKDHLKKDGSFMRKSDSRKIQRYKCKACGKRFSNASFSLAKNQNKRRLNEPIRKLLCSGVSMRRTAILLNIHRDTVKKKLVYLALKAAERQEKRLKSLERSPVTHLQFDDLITAEHTKLKPLSLSVAVNGDTRMILAASVSQIPSNGHLHKLSVEKYGPRRNLHKKALFEMLEGIKDSVSQNCLIKTDEHKLYPKAVSKFFPQGSHKTFKGARGCVAGQGELKKVVYDPLFSVNHTFAMFRYGINRLIRRTWCTTKDPAMLMAHVMVYIDFHNSRLLSG